MSHLSHPMFFFTWASGHAKPASPFLKKSTWDALRWLPRCKMDKKQEHSQVDAASRTAERTENGSNGRQDRASLAPSKAKKSETDTRRKAPARLIRRDQPGGVRVSGAGRTLIEDAAANGVSRATIAKRLGVGVKTFSDILQRDSKAQDAFDLGTAANEDELRNLLMDKARDGNVTAMIYLTKSRHGWVEGDAPDTRPNVIINLPDALPIEEYMRRVQVIQLKEPT